VSRPRGQRWVSLQVLATVALVGCGDGGRRASEGDATPVSSIPVGADRDAMATRLAQVREALAAGQPGALDDCLELAEQSLSFTDDEPATEVARMLVESGHPEQALEFLERARRRFPVERGHKNLLFPHAQALDRAGRTAEAAETFAAALAVEPVNPFEYIGSAELWVAADEFDRAATTVDQGLARHPDDPFLLQARAEVRLRRGDAAGAVEELDALIARFPDEVGPQVLLMEALAVVDRREALLAVALAFDEAYPLLGHGAVFAGLAHARGGDPGAAEQAWARAEAQIAECVECTTDQADLLGWARAQVTAETVVPLDR
jgi:predicted Zn-dependent protease